jgi:aromatic-L-amino-acid/L-tryptophan decarboxylase
MERLETNANLHTEETLDPQDWRETLALSHRMVDGAVGYLRDVRDRPVWQDLPKTFGRFLPRQRRVRPSR